MIDDPMTPESSDFSEFLGGFSIMFFSEGSIPRAKAGRLSVTKLTKRICAGSRKTASGITKEVTKIPRTSTMFVESKNRMVFAIVSKVEREL